MCLIKMRKIAGIPLYTPVLLYKSGVRGSIHTDMFSGFYRFSGLLDESSNRGPVTITITNKI